MIMNEKITFIIIEDDKQYTDRCINSIRNQIQNDPFIITIGEVAPDEFAAHLNQAIVNAKGKFVFFVKSTFVLAQTCLENLEPSENAIHVSNILHKTEDGLEYYDEDKMFIFGKVFPRNIIVNEKISIEDISAEGQIEFMLKIISSGVVIISKENAYIYADQKHIEQEISCQFIDKINEKYSNIIDMYFDADLFKYCTPIYAGEIERLRFIMANYSSIKKTFKSNAQVADNYIKPILKDIVCLQNGQTLFQLLKEYMMEISKLSYSNVIYEVLDIDESIAKLFINLKYADYVYYLNRFKNRSEKNRTEILIEQINVLRMNIEELKDTNTQLKSTLHDMGIENESIIKADGFELAQFIVDCYANGKIGFKTILKSIKMWFKYKLFKS